MGKGEDFIIAITVFLSALVLDYILYPILDGFATTFTDTFTQGVYYVGVMGIMILGTVIIPMMYILKPVETKA